MVGGIREAQTIKLLVPPVKLLYHEIYDIGTKILYKTCFDHNSAHNPPQKRSVIPVNIAFYVDSEFGIKTGFKALFKK